MGNPFPDKALQSPQIIGYARQAFGSSIKISHACGQGRTYPHRCLYRIGEFGRMRRGQRDHWGRTLMRPCDMHADGGMRAQNLARRRVKRLDRGARFILRTAARREGAAQLFQRALADVKAPRPQFAQQRRHSLAISAVGIKQRPLKIRRNLNIHRRADRRAHAVF